MGGVLRFGTALPRPHDLNPKRTGATVKLFDPHENPHRLRLDQDTVRHPFGQCFQEVEPLGGKLGGDGLGHAVIGQDAIHIVIHHARQGRHLDHHVETDPLRDIPLGLKGADLYLNDMIAQGNTVARLRAGHRLCPLRRVGKGKSNFVVGHRQRLSDQGIGPRRGRFDAHLAGPPTAGQHPKAHPTPNS